MALNIQTPMTRLVALLAGLAVTPPMTVYQGVPESLPTTTSAYIVTGAGRLVDKAAGLIQLEQEYFIGIGYRVGGAEATAEARLNAVLPLFYTAFYADRRLNSTVNSAALDPGQASQGEYVVLSGQEFRIYPLVVRVTQTQSYSN